MSSSPDNTPTKPWRIWTMVLLGSAVSALLLCGLAVYAVLQSLAQSEERAVVLSQNLATAANRSLSANIEKIDIVVGAVVGHLEHQLEQGRLEPAKARAEIHALRTDRAELDGILVTDAQGGSVVWSGADQQWPLHADLSGREWFQVQRERSDAGFYMSEPWFAEVSGLWFISFSRRYRDAAGRFAGVVTASVPLSYFKRQLQAIAPGSDAAVTLRHTDLGLIARDSPESGSDSEDEANRIGSRVVSTDLRDLVQSGRSEAVLRVRTGLSGAQANRVLSYSRLTVAPLVVTVGLGSENYLLHWRGELRNTALFCVGIVALYAMCCWLLMRAVANNLKARHRIELLAKVFDHSGEAIMLTDRDQRIIEVNPAFVKQTGYSPAEIIGHTPDWLDSPRNALSELAAIADAVRTKGRWWGEIWNRAKDGREFPKWLSITVLRDEKGEITHHIATSIDVTEVKRAEADMLHLAHHDALTQLPNRIQLLAGLEQVMATARREGAELAMLFIDMDHFKKINDTLGHQVGDGLLIEVGQRLRLLVRESDLIARLGGDEFVLVLTGVGLRGVDAAVQVGHKVLQTLGRPYLVEGHELHSTPSIGIAVCPFDGDDGHTLMKNADTAMYQAKAAGRNNFQFFTPAMNEARAERLRLEVGLRVAVERHELFLHYQPQVDMNSGQVVGLEALVRWQHPEMGLIPPLKFIPIAEDTGLIESIGTWVLERALAQVAEWRAGGHAALRMAVNLSAHQLRLESFADLVSVALQRHGLPGTALELEITESVALRDPARTAVLLRQLREFGVALAIDDFGTGYSSLAYLKQLPLSCLKLDRSFVMDLEHDANDAAICTATIQMAHSLGLAVVAEGVETAAQLEFLRRLGCDTAQGYYFSRPLSPADCGAFLRRHAGAGDPDRPGAAVCAVASVD